MRKRILSLFRNLFRKSAVEQALDDELRSSVELLTQEKMARGLPRSVAQRQALIELGGVEQVKEGVRAVRAGRILEDFGRDVRFAFRTLAKSSGFTIVAVLTLALGIGANAAIFSVVDPMLLRPLPYPNAGRLVQVSRRYRQGDIPSVSPIVFEYWKAHSRAFADAALYDLVNAGINFSAGSQPQYVTDLRVSQDFFRVLGVRPFLGRDFLPGECRPNGPPVAILSYGLWQSAFAGNRRILGGSIQINGVPHTIVGVMPRDFAFSPSAELWLPLRLAANTQSTDFSYLMLGLLKPGIDIRQAQAKTNVTFGQFHREFPQALDYGQIGVKLTPYQKWLLAIVPGIQMIPRVLFGAVVLILVIACFNVASLLLVRAAAREKEVALRAALGASRGRLIWQSLTESATLSLVAGMASLLAVYGGVRALGGLIPSSIPSMPFSPFTSFTHEIGVSVPVLGFTIVVASLAGILAGLPAALRCGNLDLNRSLKEGGRGTAGGVHLRLHGLFVVSEVALSVVLLVGATLLIRTLIDLTSAPLGFDAHHLSAVEVSLPPGRYGTAAETWSFERRVLRRIRALPGVSAAASVSALPLAMGMNTYAYVPSLGRYHGLQVEYRAVSPGYFRTMKAPLLAGRKLEESDSPRSTPVAVANQALASYFWPRKSAIGEQLHVPGSTLTVVGVAANSKESEIGETPDPTVFVPQSQVPDEMNASGGFLTALVIRSQTPLHEAPIARVIAEVDPELAIARFEPMERVVANSVRPQRLVTIVLGLFAALALLLASVGVYGVISYLAALRMHEISIRVALGAQRADIRRLVFGQGLSLALLGVGAGIVGALGLTRFLSSWLYGVQPTDTFALASASIVLIAVALLACFVPARRAMRVDPNVALRQE